MLHYSCRWIYCTTITQQWSWWAFYLFCMHIFSIYIYILIPPSRNTLEVSVIFYTYCNHSLCMLCITISSKEISELIRSLELQYTVSSISMHWVVSNFVKYDTVSLWLIKMGQVLKQKEIYNRQYVNRYPTIQYIAI